jgi:hypothetical protein
MLTFRLLKVILKDVIGHRTHPGPKTATLESGGCTAPFLRGADKLQKACFNAARFDNAKSGILTRQMCAQWEARCRQAKLAGVHLLRW